jgi:hypothetical protein
MVSENSSLSSLIKEQDCNLAKMKTINEEQELQIYQFKQKSLPFDGKNDLKT